MGIFDSIKKTVFGVSYANKLMKSINAPVFVKDFNRENEEIAQLYSRLNNTKDEAAKKKIENEIYLKKFVHDGLSKVYFELKNSPVPYYGLYNIRLEQGGTAANIDFLIVTNQFCCIVKSKSLQGNIEIDNHGNFSRWTKKGDKWSKEGLYSPIEQNRRAAIILQSIINSNLNADLPILSLVVFTNPKATLNFKETPREIEDKVIKVDLLNTKLRELVENTQPPVFEEAFAGHVANLVKSLDTSSKAQKQEADEENISMDTKEPDQDSSSASVSMTANSAISVSSALINVDDENLRKALKTYRTATATANNIPAYFIYNNEEMERIIEAKPRSKEQLTSIKGFGDVKVNKYGEDIIKIINSVLD